MCWQVTIVLALIIIAHMIPKESHYKYRGSCMPNSTLVWDPPSKVKGMIFMHLAGNGTVHWNGNTMPVIGHAFFHSFGSLPRIDYKSNRDSLKVTAHLVT